MIKAINLRFGVLGIVCAAVCLFGSQIALGDDVNITTSINGTGVAVVQNFEHEEASPFKGWANITVTNTGTEAWGDFHFFIFQVGAETVENIDFIVDAPNQPTSSQSGLSWDVDNSVTGATIDLYFYSDPILPTETATFSVYTDNTTDQRSFFGLAMYPTPVPEPASLTLVGLGGLLLSRRRR